VPAEEAAEQAELHPSALTVAEQEEES